MIMIFEFYEQKYFEKVYLKLNLVQSNKQKRPKCISMQATKQIVYAIIVFTANFKVFKNGSEYNRKIRKNNECCN